MSKCWVLSQRERQVQREEAQELTEKLDQDWRNIQALMVKKTPKAEQANIQEEKPKVRMHQSIGIVDCQFCVLVPPGQSHSFLLYLGFLLSFPAGWV